MKAVVFILFCLAVVCLSGCVVAHKGKDGGMIYFRLGDQKFGGVLVEELPDGRTNLYIDQQEASGRIEVTVNGVPFIKAAGGGQ